VPVKCVYIFIPVLIGDESKMTIDEVGERYNIPQEILREYESWGLCGTVKQVMRVWQLWRHGFGAAQHDYDPPRHWF
jgi:hypothetical protein